MTNNSLASVGARRRGALSADAVGARQALVLLEPMVPAAAPRPPRRRPSSVTWSTGGASCAVASGGFSAGCAARRSRGLARRRAAPLHAPAAELQRRAHAVRPVHRRHHPAQRARDRRLAVGPRCRLGRRAGAARLLRIPAVGLLSGPRAGAAIRRARTRLPGGGDNPVAIIRVPRERMVGSGIASSLVHEVGHQAAASRPGRLAAPHLARDAGRAADRGRVAFMGALDFRDGRRLLVGGARWHRRHDGPDRRRQLAARLRLPAQRGRPASGAVDSRQAQLRVGPGALSAPAVGAASRLWDSFYPVDARDRSARAARALTAGMPASSRCSSITGHGCCAVDRSSRCWRSVSVSRRGSRLFLKAWRRAREDARRAPVAGVRRARPGPRRREFSPEDESRLFA